MAKRYLVFGGDGEGASNGGWEDFIGATDSREEALSAVDDHYEENGPDTWCHVVDTKTMKFITTSSIDQDSSVGED